MKTSLRSALGDAMTRLETADVAGATAAIQRALAGNRLAGQPYTGTSDAGTSRVDAPVPRRLGEVLAALGAHRARSAAAPSRPGPSAPDSETGAGDDHFRTRSFRHAAGSVTYKLYVPAGHADRQLALVVMLHGCTQDPDDFARGTGMNALADAFGLIVAYPHQPRSANAQGCWNWFDLRHQQRDSGEPAVLAGLAKELAAEFGIARERVFAAGLSAGGAMADVLSFTHPDVFAAVGIHSGLPHGAANDVMTAFAAMKGNGTSAAAQKKACSRKIIFHGTADATVHPSNGERVFDRARGGLSGLQELTSDMDVGGRRVTRTLLSSASGGAIAEHWAIEGAGHAWSGGDRSGSFTEAGGPSASREMIRFFLER